MQLIAASGDAVTGVGKKIALSAKLLPPEKSYYNKYFASSGHGNPHEGKLSHWRYRLLQLDSKTILIRFFPIYTFHIYIYWLIQTHKKKKTNVNQN